MVRNAEYSKKRYFFLKKTLKITNRGVYYLKSIWAPVAQLDRASASGVEGHEFESRRVYHFFFAFFRLRIPVLRHFCFLLPKAAKWCKSNKKSVKSPAGISGAARWPVQHGGFSAMAADTGTRYPLIF